MVEFGGTTSEVAKHIRALYEENGKKLTARILLDAATPDTHPLHVLFEWDDTLLPEIIAWSRHDGSFVLAKSPSRIRWGISDPFVSSSRW